MPDRFRHAERVQANRGLRLWPRLPSPVRGRGAQPPSSRGDAAKVEDSHPAGAFVDRHDGLYLFEDLAYFLPTEVRSLGDDAASIE